MREILIQDDTKLVEAKIHLFEQKTGCELLVVVANASDTYPAASLRFGIISTFLLSITSSYYFEFEYGWMWPVFFLILTALMTWVGHFDWAKRLGLSDWEVDRECVEKAIEHFHTLGTSKVSHKVTAMIMVSLLEKNIEVLIDEKLKTKITDSDLKELVETMKVHFLKGNIGLGLISCIQKLEEKIIADFGGKVSDTPPAELSDTIHFINI